MSNPLQWCLESQNEFTKIAVKIYTIMTRPRIKPLRSTNTSEKEKDVKIRFKWKTFMKIKKKIL